MLGDSVSTGTTDQQGGVAEVKGTQLGDKLDSFIKPPECSNDVNLELRQRNRGDLTADSVQRGARHGLEQYLSRFEEAMKLRKQLISENPVKRMEVQQKNLTLFEYLDWWDVLFLLLESELLFANTCPYLLHFLLCNLRTWDYTNIFPRVKRR